MTPPATPPVTPPVTEAVDTACPCGSGRPIRACCGPYLSGAAIAPTPEALMRARYSAFATQNIDYIEQTVLIEKREDFDREKVADWAVRSQWNGLEIRSAPPPDETEGWVEFVARFSLDGKEYLHHESSRFLYRLDRWWYSDGIMGPRPRAVTKVGRNDLCPCGSGKKYKKCCGAAA
ncbi:MAG: YchJ family protein [Azospirillaceae bacterium]|nr:YchJ family protein [Azospirillaceae bacterium]